MTQVAATTAAGDLVTEQQPDVLEMSDEELLKLESPPPAVESKTTEVQPVVTPAPEVQTEDKTQQTTPTTEVTTSETVVNGGNVAPNAQVTQQDPHASSAATTTTSTEGQVGGQKTEQPAGAVAPAATSTGTSAVTVDYQAEYERILKPFKANGRMIEPRNIDEVIQLAQQGANFTRKMQDLAPHRKALLMLQNHGIDEAKLSYLIDLDKKNPQAIQKLVKDAGIDPMDIDTSAEPAYQAGNHVVSDEAAAFHSTLQDLSGSEEGTKTVAAINSTWDQASKEALWKHPEIMTVIHQQRETGVYDRIAAEVDRRRMLGTISPETPFLQAYEAIGKEMIAATQAGGQGGQPSGAPASNAQPVATTVAAPKPTVANGDQASAASSTRNSPRKAETLVNPLSMSDEEFMKLAKLPA